MYLGRRKGDKAVQETGTTFAHFVRSGRYPALSRARLPVGPGGGFRCEMEWPGAGSPNDNRGDRQASRMSSEQQNHQLEPPVFVDPDHTCPPASREV